MPDYSDTHLVMRHPPRNEHRIEFSVDEHTFQRAIATCYIGRERRLCGAETAALVQGGVERDVTEVMRWLAWNWPYMPFNAEFLRLIENHRLAREELAAMPPLPAEDDEPVGDEEHDAFVRATPKDPDEPDHEAEHG